MAGKKKARKYVGTVKGKAPSCSGNGARQYLKYKNKIYECCGSKGRVACHIFDEKRLAASQASALRIQKRIQKEAAKASADVQAEIRDMRASMAVPGAGGASYDGYSRSRRRRRSRR